MSTAQLRKRAKQAIDQLSGARLQFAAEFLLYFQDKGSEQATAELLGIRGFAQSFSRGVKDLRNGRAVPWRKVRRDV